jgi:ribosomal protein S21
LGLLVRICIGIASAVKTQVMNVRVVVREGEAIQNALRRLKQALQDARVFDEIMIHADFESHRAKRRLKRILAKQRAQDWAFWERLRWHFQGRRAGS